MAYAYEVGQGVEQDLIKAIELYQRAADAGEENAIKSLKRIHDELLANEEKPARAISETAVKKNSEEN
jgi:TPR repeat protein